MSIHHSLSWITVIWSMAASACLALAAMNFLVWFKKRRAWANLLFALMAAATAAVAFWEIVHWPITLSFFFIFFVVAIGYKMNRDVFRAAQLSDELRESETRLKEVAERKKSEKEAARLRFELWHLSRTMAMNELSSSLAHEINQPLGAILNNASAAKLLMAQGEDKREEIDEILADIIKDSKRAGDVIRKIRGLVKKSSVQFESLSLNALIEDVVGLFHGSLNINKVSLVLELNPELPKVRADHVHLQQVFLNLITNALDAMKENSVKKLLIRSSESGAETVTVSISDSGAGIDEARKDKVFEPFVTTKKDGLGFGLAICRSIIEEHGGRIWAENNPAGGATFSFSLKAWKDGSA